MDNKQIALNVGVFAAGALAGVLVTKKFLEEKYAQLAQEEIDSVKEVFEMRMDASPTEDKKSPNENGMTEQEYDNISKIPTLTRDTSKQGDSPYSRARVAYNDMAKDNIRKQWDQEKQAAVVSTEDEGDGEENPADVDASGSEEGDFVDTDTERDLSKVDRTAPYVITDREFTDEFPHHDKLTLYYYTVDDVLCDEHDDILDDIDRAVGWEFFPMLEMQNTVWVRNEPLATDFEICAVRQSFAESVAGMPPKKNLSPREKYAKMKRKDEDNDE